MNWKELEMRFIVENVYLYVATVMLFCTSETCAKFHFVGRMEIERRRIMKEVKLISTTK